MTDGTPRAAWKDTIPIACSLIGAAVVIGGALRADGGRDAQIEDNTRRIVVLEEEGRSKTELLQKIDGRTIRIETKLEMIAPAREDPR